MRPDQGKDYFAILGVTPQADPAVMKAAYRALAKKYHPDLNSDGDAAPAREKFLEIQEAYDLLSDEDQLAHYMHLRTRMHNEQAAAAMRHQRPSVRLCLDDRWDHLIREHPGLRQYHARFCLMSPRLGRQFKLTILGTPKQGAYHSIATKMERRFYRRYFSYHRDLQTLARRLAVKRRRHALRELSREINGRRLLSRSSRRALLARYEARYLKPNVQANPGYRQPLISLPGVQPVSGSHQRPPPAAKAPALSRAAAWFSMGMALFADT
jgi:curved DNA-binding protein CbpA